MEEMKFLGLKPRSFIQKIIVKEDGIETIYCAPRAIKY